MAARLTMNGGSTSRYPCADVCRSSIKLIKARSSLAPEPDKTANRAPAIFAARSKSRMPSASPMSQWLFAGADRFGGVPQRRRSEEHTSELQSQFHLVCRLLLEKKKKNDR